MKLSRRSLTLALATALGLGANLSADRAEADIIIAENLLVSLNASDATAGTASWLNGGTLGGAFMSVGGPTTGMFGSADAPGISFDGSQAYTGPIAPVSITGPGTRTIEVWAYNEALNPEETMVSWGRRGGGPDGSNLAFNWGSNGTYGAVGHWGSPDMGWNGNPATNEWHHLVYTYDGVTTRVYDNGVLKNSRAVALNTHAGFPINLASQNSTNGTPPGTLDGGNRLSGAIGAVRVHDGVLNAAAILNNFQQDAAFYGAVAPPPPPPPTGLVSLWRFDESADVGNDSMARNNDLTAQGNAAYTAGGKYGGAVALDGAGDMLDRATFPADLPIGDEAYTVAAWFQADNPRVGPDARGIIGWGNYGGGRQVNALRLAGDNGFAHYWWGADLAASDAQVGAHDVDVDDGQWHHIAATYDPLTGQRTLYLNGQLLAQDSPGPNGAAAGNFAIGRTCITCQGGEFFDGMLDDVAAFDMALSAAQVNSIMTGNFSEFGGPVPEPSTFVLAAFGGVALIYGARRRARSK
jgi:hypothetical protein